MRQALFLVLVASWDADQREAAVLRVIVRV
jgi:hypothetical protein